jgi:hypothetical protein
VAPRNTGYEIGGDAEDLRNKFRSPECNAMMDQTIEAGLLTPTTAAVGGALDDPLVKKLLRNAGMAGGGGSGSGAIADGGAGGTGPGSALANANKERGGGAAAAATATASCGQALASLRNRYELAGLISAEEFFPQNSDVYRAGEDALESRRQGDEALAQKRAEIIAAGEALQATFAAARAEEAATASALGEDGSETPAPAVGAAAAAAVHAPGRSSVESEDSQWEELEEILRPLSDDQVERVMMQAIHASDPDLDGAE